MSLFQKTSIGNLTVGNRFVRSATAEGLATARGFCSPVLTKLLVRLAKGGVGLIITGHTAVSREGMAASRQLCLWNDGFISALLDMTGQVHEAGGKILLQLGHAGALADANLTGEASVGPMMTRKKDGTTCRAMSRDDIRETSQSFAAAAGRARKAGFDGVQIQAAHGYLLSTFLSPHSNRRRDEYGGTVANRARFLLEVIAAVVSETGKDYPVLVKINASDFLPDGYGVDQMIETASLLALSGICAIELSGGIEGAVKYMPSRPGRIHTEKEGYYKAEAERLKEATDMPVILVGGIRSLETAADFIEDEVCDFIAMSRPFIREPELIHRWMTDNKKSSDCDSDNLCYRPIQAGKGFYCLTKARELQRSLLRQKDFKRG
jgi:2,4-dienoyl-CoA reductase-like NADH-dependent reductase (Old Yellow Enzyme family)